MTQLRVPSHAPDDEGNVLRVTPEAAGWKHVGFEVYALRKGGTLRRETGDQEACLVILSGRANVTTMKERWTGVGERMSVFEGPPYAIYVPATDRYELEAVTDLEVAVCLAPGKGTYAARLIAPDQVRLEDRGTGNNARKIRNVLPEQEPADSVLVVEVITPPGHWSSYPPHKHDRDAPPEESCLEETYYHRIDPPGGFAFQRVYTDDRSLDETVAVNDGDVVLVPRGYHPVGAPPGYQLYYLNVMAGPTRTWKFQNDPQHAWVIEAQTR